MGFTCFGRLLLLAALFSMTAWQVTAQGQERAWLGVSVMNVPKAWPAHVAGTAGGALVARVEAAGPALSASIQVGDIIVAVDAQSVRDTRELVCLVQSRKPGDMLNIALLRRGARHTVAAKLGVWPNPPPPRAEDCADAVSGRIVIEPAA
jgi:S1-C subfamily serine protease